MIVRKLWGYTKKGISLLKYIFTKEIVDLDVEKADAHLKQLAPPINTTPETHNALNDEETDLMIIVPAYNAEQWIEECVESIISQETGYSFQAVFVDDGSTDNTGKILDKYVDNERVKIIHQRNKGYSGARNVALKNLTSRYIMFVDSDDYLLPNAIQCLMETAIKNDADIVEADGVRFNESGVIGSIKAVRNKNVEDSYWGGPCLKVMKSSLWERIEFPEGYLYEDTIIGSLIFPLAHKIVYIDNKIYAYRIHNNSITQRHDVDLKRVDSYWITLLMAQIQKKYNIPYDYNNYRRNMKHVVFTYRRTILLPESIKKGIFIGTCDFIESNYKDFMRTKDKYYLLAHAVQRRDYGKYAVFCEDLMF